MDLDAKIQALARSKMVLLLRRYYGIRDERVLSAMEKIQRHLFIPEAFRDGADPYGDHPCPIGWGQTISQPYIVAYMTEKIAPQPSETVLEIGTGSGYQAAVLAELGASVFSVEIIPELAEHARAVLASQGYDQVKVRCGDGREGWPGAMPFDIIIGTCAPEEIPDPLVEQLAEGGRMILPVGRRIQQLVILRRKGRRLLQENALSVRFVPMV
jgi:protein-L-isoaspartate(D-aspartate) O-methyltransferase